MPLEEILKAALPKKAMRTPDPEQQPAITAKTIANALHAERRTMTAIAKNADIPTSIRDGWERSFS